MFLKSQKWLLLPLSFFFGLVLLIAFVSLSQNYLSEYLVRNSKAIVGTKVELAKLSEHLKTPLIADWQSNLGQEELVLVFWSVNCAPCLEKLAQLEKLNPKNYYLPINTDKEKDISHAQLIQQQIAPQTPWIWDRDQFLLKQFQIDYLPTHIYMNREGTISKVEVGRN